MEAPEKAKAYLIKLAKGLNPAFEVSVVPNRRPGIPSSFFLRVQFLKSSIPRSALWYGVSGRSAG